MSIFKYQNIIYKRLQNLYDFELDPENIKFTPTRVPWTTTMRNLHFIVKWLNISYNDIMNYTKLIYFKKKKFLHYIYLKKIKTFRYSVQPYYTRHIFGEKFRFTQVGKFRQTVDAAKRRKEWEQLRKERLRQERFSVAGKRKRAAIARARGLAKARR